MRYMLDTHSLIWYFEGDFQLPPALKDLIEELEHPVYVSIASFWEIAIKVSLNKLALSQSLQTISEHILSLQIEILPVTIPHLLHLQSLPFHHRDPFDRLLIAQSQVESLRMISKDSIFDTYLVDRIWKDKN